MSYDFNLYLCQKPSYAEPMFEAEGWEAFGEDGKVFRKKGWQLVVDRPNPVEAEDLPEQVLQELPGIRYLVTMNLEGDYPAKALKLMEKVAQGLTKAGHGIWENPQEGVFKTPAGIKRWVPAPKGEDHPPLTLGWWFLGTNLLDPALQKNLLDTFKKFLPEALPRRYGPWEPAEYKWEVQGEEHFLNFLNQELQETQSVNVWVGTKPVDYLSMGFPDPQGSHPLGFRTGRLAMHIKPGTLNQPGWALALHRLFAAVAQVLKPFYAEIREGKEEIKSWWWRGLPAVPPLALVLGSPYLELWPEAAAQGKILEPGMRLLSGLENWEPGQPHSSLPEAPAHLAQPREKTPRSINIHTATEAEKEAFFYPKPEFPPAWPFEAPGKPLPPK